MNIIVTIVGNSLLENVNNHINRGTDSQNKWNNIFKRTKNCSEEELNDEEKKTFAELKKNGKRLLSKLQIKESTIDSLAAEFKGIKIFYNNDFSKIYCDYHYLIGIDTAQNLTCLCILEDYFIKQKLSFGKYISCNLDSKNTKEFREGIKKLISHLESHSGELKNMLGKNSRIIFNLSGTSEKIREYIAEAGKLYADEVVYEFDNKNMAVKKELQILSEEDVNIFREKSVEFALMAQGASLDIETSSIPEIFIEVNEGITTLSEQGKIVWSRIKRQILSEKLLQFPHLEYTPEFIQNFSDGTIPDERLKLQEKLAYVSRILKENNGDMQCLKNCSGIGYGNLISKKVNNIPVGHFRISRRKRVSCQKLGGTLVLRKYGKHDDVNNCP
jgi:hypothetical protein